MTIIDFSYNSTDNIRSFNWTIPQYITSLNITAIGGGGGGYYYSNFQLSNGGSGANVVSTYNNLVPGAQLTINLGGGGGGSNNSGGGGGLTEISGNNIYIIAGGGGGGGNYPSINGGNGGNFDGSGDIGNNSIPNTGGYGGGNGIGGLGRHSGGSGGNYRFVGINATSNSGGGGSGGYNKLGGSGSGVVGGSSGYGGGGSGGYGGGGGAGYGGGAGGGSGGAGAGYGGGGGGGGSISQGNVVSVAYSPSTNSDGYGVGGAGTNGGNGYVRIEYDIIIINHTIDILWSSNPYTPVFSGNFNVISVDNIITSFFNNTNLSENLLASDNNYGADYYFDTITLHFSGSGTNLIGTIPSFVQDLCSNTITEWQLWSANNISYTTNIDHSIGWQDVITDINNQIPGKGYLIFNIDNTYIPPPQPPSPIINKNICPCPPKVTAKKNFQFGGNIINSSNTNALRYSQLVRSTIGSIQRVNVNLSPFGYYEGGPSGSGQPIRNSF